MQRISTLYGHELSNLVADNQLFIAADLNNIGITDALVPGVVLWLPDAVTPSIFSESRPSNNKQPLVKAKAGQTWVDMALQETGTADTLFDLCDANGAGITDAVLPGMDIALIDTDPANDKTITLLRGVAPASQKQVEAGAPAEEGIEFWSIEIDFTVS